MHRLHILTYEYVNFIRFCYFIAETSIKIFIGKLINNDILIRINPGRVIVGRWNSAYNQANSK